MSADQVVMQFQEWHLAEALAQLGKAEAFWSRPIVHTTSAESPSSLARLFQAPPPLNFAHQAPLLREDAAGFGFNDPEYFRRTFWGLRPDFTLRAEDVIVFLEAKGRSTPPRTWTNPKEAIYYRFLREANVGKKGCCYVIPRSSEDSCRTCLAQYFQGQSDVCVGYILWEDFLPMLAPDLLQVAVDEMVRVIDGLRYLREWQRQAR